MVCGWRGVMERCMVCVMERCVEGNAWCEVCGGGCMV